MGMCGMVRVGGQVLRFAGLSSGGGVPAMEQKSCVVEATTTTYEFEGGGILLKVEFMSPAFIDDLDLLSSPIAYVRFSYLPTSEVLSIEIYFDATAEWCVNESKQKVEWGRLRCKDREVLRVGSLEQPVLEKVGDNLRIDWGHLYLAPPKDAQSVAGADKEARSAFIENRQFAGDDFEMPRPAHDHWPVLSTRFEVAAGESKSVLLAYDDQLSLQWMKRPVVAYWRRSGQSFDELLLRALSDESALFEKAKQLDEKIRRETEEVGGEIFADIACLSYRQALAAHKIVADIDGKPMMFSKENFSNGCIGTVDVLYPACPLMLAYNPELLEANLRPLFIYASLPRWHWDFAPHDLGTYPHANGQVYGGGERTEEDQMPVEESGNMLILAGAFIEQGGSKEFLLEYQPLLDKWASFLLEKGLDPENQLCTDDFAGHLAHNANLSIKAIVALGAYSKLLTRLGGHEERASEIRAAAESMVGKWIELAIDGDHYKLAFDKPGSWSQKYNLAFDKILRLNLFPNEVYQTEMKHYRSVMNEFGLPLDSRKTWTKLDWCVWTACLGESKEEFEEHVAPLWKMVNETTSRVPLTDWYETVGEGAQVGFQARSVVGGVFIPLLLNSWV
jgi:hypothetical protein